MAATDGPRKLKIALVTSVIDNREGRGTALVARELLSRLLIPNAEFEFTLIHHEPADNPIYEQFPTLLIPHLPGPFDRQMIREAVFWLGLRSKGTRFDIVHYMNPRVWPSYLLTPGKVVVTMHEAGVMLPLAGTGLAHSIFKFTYRFLHQRMERVIAVSRFGKEEIVQYCKIPEARISVIPNALPETFRPAVRADRKEYLQDQFGIPSPYILSVGRLDPHKNILRLLDAYSIARAAGIEEHLVLVGGRHLAAYSAEVDARISELGISEFVYLAPFIPETDLPNVYAEAQTLVYPSLHEGFGLPLLEAMICGTPVTASNAGSLPEIAGDAAVFFNPADTDDMASCLIRIMRDAAMRSDCIARGYERVKDFSWDRSAAQLVALYKDLGRN